MQADRYHNSENLDALLEEPPASATNIAAASPFLLGSLPLALDARLLGYGGTGVASYARGLQQAQRRLTAQPIVLQAHATDDGRLRKLAGALNRRPRLMWSTPGLDGSRLMGRDLFRRAHVRFSIYGTPLRVVAPGPCGIMHWTYPVPIVLDAWANLYTVHDAIPLTHPDLTPIDPRRHRRVLTALAREAAGFVTVSAAARDDILTATGWAPDRVSDAGQAVDAVAPPPGDLPSGLSAGRYFLFCGAIEPRKNLARLLAAYRDSGVAEALVLAGPPGWRSASILDEAAKTSGVRVLPFQSRDDLLRLIAGARALLFPSLAEGFGLPVVEAMALGTPVLTSRGGALEEVAGGAALLVNPEDAGEIAGGLRRLAAASPTEIERWASLGRARAQDFSLARFAARLAVVYRQAMSPPSD